MTSKALTLRDTYLSSALQVILGSVFLAIMAQAAIPLPFTPVPISLQTLGVALLAIDRHMVYTNNIDQSRIR